MPHNQSHEEYSFEILVIDTTLQSKYKTTRAIKRFIEADEEIFNSLGVHVNTDCIEVIQKDPPSAEVVPQLSFFIRIKSEKDILNKTREQVINHLRTADFSRVMTINDDVSISIGCEIYPLIARVENTMRAMVVKYFATSGEGLGFWDKTIKIIAEKTKYGRVNKKLIVDKQESKDDRVFEIHFPDLGSMIYELKPGYSTISEYESAIDEVNDLNDLRSKIRTPYDVVFKKNFRDKKFKEKWESLKKIRDKVAHNKFLDSDDYDEALSLHDDIIETLKEADSDLVGVQFTNEDIEKYQESIKHEQKDAGEEITRDAFLSALKRSEQIFSDKGKYVGLMYFINNIIVDQLGYRRFSVQDLLDTLKGVDVDIYEVPHPSVPDRTISAIRRIV